MSLEKWGELSIPQLALMLPSKERDGTSAWSKIKNKALSVTDWLKLTRHYRLHLLCDGPPGKERYSAECTEPHEGYGFDAPGSNDNDNTI